MTSTPPRASSSVKTAMRSPFARLQRPQRRDDAADAGVGLDRLRPAGAPGVAARAVGRRVGELAGRPRAELLQLARGSDRSDGRSSTGRAFPSRTRAARFRSTASPRAAEPLRRVRRLSSALEAAEQIAPGRCPSIALHARAVLARGVDRGEAAAARSAARRQRGERRDRPAPASRTRRPSPGSRTRACWRGADRDLRTARAATRSGPASCGPRAATRSRLRRRS